MSRINLDLLLTVPDGLHLAASTQCSWCDGLPSPVMGRDDHATSL